MNALSPLMRSEREAMKDLVPCWLNVYQSPEGLVSSSAHLSEEDALDDISSPTEGWVYVRTIVSKGSMTLTQHLADEAADYAARCTREWLDDERNNRFLANAQAVGR